LKTNKEKILLCGNIESPALALCQRLHIQVKTAEDVYVALKNAAALPQQYLGDPAPTHNKRHLKFWFSKRNSKRFLISAVLVFSLSLLTPFFYYYVATSIVLLLVSVFVRIFGKSEI
jgi:hypothetical protein